MENKKASTGVFEPKPKLSGEAAKAKKEEHEQGTLPNDRGIAKVTNDPKAGKVVKEKSPLAKAGTGMPATPSMGGMNKNPIGAKRGGYSGLQTAMRGQGQGITNKGVGVQKPVAPTAPQAPKAPGAQKQSGQVTAAKPNMFKGEDMGNSCRADIGRLQKAFEVSKGKMMKEEGVMIKAVDQHLSSLKKSLYPEDFQELRKGILDSLKGMFGQAFGGQDYWAKQAAATAPQRQRPNRRTEMWDASGRSMIPGQAGLGGAMNREQAPHEGGSQGMDVGDSLDWQDQAPQQQITGRPMGRAGMWREDPSSARTQIDMPAGGQSAGTEGMDVNDTEWGDMMPQGRNTRINARPDHMGQIRSQRAAQQNWHPDDAVTDVPDHSGSSAQTRVMPAAQANFMRNQMGGQQASQMQRPSTGSNARARSMANRQQFLKSIQESVGRALQKNNVLGNNGMLANEDAKLKKGFGGSVQAQKGFKDAARMAPQPKMGTVQSAPKITQPDHAQRHDMLSSFMPKGKFDKSLNKTTGQGENIESAIMDVANKAKDRHVKKSGKFQGEISNAVREHTEGKKPEKK